MSKLRRIRKLQEVKKETKKTVIQYQLPKSMELFVPVKPLPPEIPVYKDLLTMKEVMGFLGISRSTIQRWIHLGYFPVVRIGKYIRINPKDVNSFLKKGYVCIRQ